MNPDQEFLASAYLDGDLTANERRRAEADPAVMAEVDELRALRVRLGDAEQPSAATRDAAIAAAMGEFARLHATTPEPDERRTGHVVPLTRRPRYATWLGVAAAVVAIGVLGVVVSNGFGGRGGDDTVADEASAADATIAEAESRLVESAPATDEASSSIMAAEAADGDDAGPAAESDAGADAADAAGSAASELQVDPAMFFTLSGQPNENGTPVPIETPEELTAAVGYLLDLAEQGELGPTPETRCPYPVLAEAVVRTGPTRTVDVYVAALLDDEVVAIEQESCDIVLESVIDR